MTGYDIYNKVLNLSGNRNHIEDDFSEQIMLERMPDIINQICFDLKIPLIKVLENEIIATEPQIDALCYGTAMLLSLSEGETEQNRLFTQIYNAKRAAVLSEIQKIQDSLPTVSYGVD